MAYNPGIPERKNMAMGEGCATGDFGVKPLDHSKGPAMSSEADMKKSHVGDGDRRGAGKPVKHTKGEFPSQSAPDHGPHFSREIA